MTTLRFIELDTCASTNDEAWAEWGKLSRIERETAAIAVLARSQSQGRGRQGRKWESGAAGSNLLLSLATAPPSRALTWLPLAAGVAAVEAVIGVCAGIAKPEALENLRLKWPNDVLIGDAKLGGILCETRFSGDKATGAVIGIGLNLTEAPALHDGTATASLSANPIADELRSRLAREFCERILSWIAKLSQGQTAELREIWRRMAKLYQYCELRTHDDAGNEVRLRIVDLDQDGRLVAEADPMGTASSKLVTLDQP